MGIQWPAFIGFVVVTTFTPGPNNIASMSVGLSHGYRKTLRFILGVATGFFGVMCLCAVIAELLIGFVPSAEPYLRIAASLYIVWLAVHTFLGSLKADAEAAPPLAFKDGLLLQLLNPKVIVYGLTLYSSFLLALAGHVGLLALSAAIFALVSFASTSTWSLAGTSLARVFRRPVARKAIAGALALLLLYSAVESSGLLAPRS